MTPIKRPLAAAGAAVLFALSLTACGGVPADASVEDFCKVTQDNASQEEFGKAVQEEDWDKIVELIQDQAEEVEEVGTPEDISDDAREGFEIQLDAAKDISADDLEKAFKDNEDPFEEGLSDEDQKKVEAYTEYENETCDESDSGADSGSDDATSDEATEVPTEDLPTDIPSIDPSDLPTELSPEDLASLQSELEKLTESAATE